MSPIRIVTDSASDLPQELADEHRIQIVPLRVRFGEEEFVDRQDLTPTEFWSRIKSSPVLPETSAPSAGQFEEAFRRAASEGADGVVCINLSGELSATIQSAQVAAKAVADTIPVRVIDSRSCSMGVGNLCLAAAELAEQGKGLEDIAGTIEDLVPRLRVFAALDTLENLKKGGRIGGAQAMLGSLLSIKPIIQISGGVDQESKQRTRSKSLKYLAEKVREHAPVERLAVVHAQAGDVDELLGYLADIAPRDQIIVADIGAVIGAHGGPGTTGVTFLASR